MYLMILFALIIETSNAQENQDSILLKNKSYEKFNSTDMIIDYFPPLPEVIGGIESIQSKIIYPKEALKNNIQGRVIVKSINSSNGDVQDVEVVKGLGYGCDEEARRVVLESKWKPYYINDSCSNYKVLVPLLFKINKK